MPSSWLDIDHLRGVLRVNQAKWSAGENHLTRLHPEEIARHLGCALGPDDVPLEEMESVGARVLAHTQALRQHRALLRAAAPAFPPSMDWRNKNGSNWVTSVKYQGTCGTCTCFAVAAAMETAICIHAGKPPAATDGGEYPSLSEAQMFYCGAAAQDRNCLNGWYLSSALSYAATTGVAPASYFPYTSGDQACGIKPGWQQAVSKISGSTKLTNTDDAKQWIATKGPIVAMMLIYQDFIGYQSGVYTHATGDKMGAHAVCVIGYDDAQQAWLCKNSWSTAWGEAGFFQIGYGQCGIESAMSGLNGLAVVDGTPVAAEAFA